jgi:hypothetical protein
MSNMGDGRKERWNFLDIQPKASRRDNSSIERDKGQMQCEENIWEELFQWQWVQASLFIDFPSAPEIYSIKASAHT